MRKFAILFLLPLVFGGCISFPFDISRNSRWAGEIKTTRQNAKATVRIQSVSAERSGEWGSLEKEAIDLLPLLFSEESYMVVQQSAEADYSAEVKLREREYTDGWRTKRSLSAEVRLWERNNTGPLPVSAGRSLIQGKQSLASSKTLTAILRKAVGNAVRGLPGDKQ